MGNCSNTWQTTAGTLPVTYTVTNEVMSSSWAVRWRSGDQRQQLVGRWGMTGVWHDRRHAWEGAQRSWRRERTKEQLSPWQCRHLVATFFSRVTACHFYACTAPTCRSDNDDVSRFFSVCTLIKMINFYSFLHFVCVLFSFICCSITWRTSSKRQIFLDAMRLLSFGSFFMLCKMNLQRQPW